MTRPPSALDELICPGCGARFKPDQRFCPSCALPLIKPGPDQPDDSSERHRRARKIKPQLAEGQLVRVAGARNQAEAEFIQGLLLEEGVPSLIRRSAGFDVPDFLAAGPRDILVPLRGLDTAREVLLEAELLSPETASAPVSPVKLLSGLVLALMVGVLIVWVAAQLVH